MADCNFAYPKPDDFQAAAKNVIAKITGSSAVDNACAVHCGWVVLGYGANLLLPCEEAGSDLSGHVLRGGTLLQTPCGCRSRLGSVPDSTGRA